MLICSGRSLSVVIVVVQCGRSPRFALLGLGLQSLVDHPKLNQTTPAQMQFSSLDLTWHKNEPLPYAVAHPCAHRTSSHPRRLHRQPCWCCSLPCYNPTVRHANSSRSLIWIRDIACYVVLVTWTWLRCYLSDYDILRRATQLMYYLFWHSQAQFVF